MITRVELQSLYEWAKQTEFPTKKAPTTDGYCNKQVSHYWLKGVGKSVMIRKKLMTEDIIKIHSNDDLLYSGYSSFDPGTILKPHRDPNIYREPYKRIQIPLEIPDKEKCYMIWKGEKVFWKEGVSKVYEVMDYLHEGANLSDAPMKFLFIDVKKDCVVDI